MSAAKAPLVFITGASSGIGQALAARYYAAGYRLALSARRTAEIEAWSAHVLDPDRFRIYGADVAQVDSIVSAGRACIEQQGVPDVVNDTFFSVDIPPTWVHDGFFVGASAKPAGGQDRPARIDADGPATAAWFFYAPDIAATIDDLAAAPYGTPVSAAGLPIPGVFMVRATGQDAP